MIVEYYVNMPWDELISTGPFFFKNYISLIRHELTHEVKIRPKKNSGSKLGSWPHKKTDEIRTWSWTRPSAKQDLHKALNSEKMSVEVNTRFWGRDRLQNRDEEDLRLNQSAKGTVEKLKFTVRFVSTSDMPSSYWKWLGPWRSTSELLRHADLKWFSVKNWR